MARQKKPHPNKAGVKKTRSTNVRRDKSTGQFRPRSR